MSLDDERVQATTEWRRVITSLEAGVSQGVKSEVDTISTAHKLERKQILLANQVLENENKGLKEDLHNLRSQLNASLKKEIDENFVKKQKEFNGLYQGYEQIKEDCMIYQLQIATLTLEIQQYRDKKVKFSLPSQVKEDRAGGSRVNSTKSKSSSSLKKSSSSKQVSRHVVVKSLASSARSHSPKVSPRRAVATRSASVSASSRQSSRASSPKRQAKTLVKSAHNTPRKIKNNKSPRRAVLSPQRASTHEMAAEPRKNQKSPRRSTSPWRVASTSTTSQVPYSSPPKRSSSSSRRQSGQSEQPVISSSSVSSSSRDLRGRQTNLTSARAGRGATGTTVSSRSRERQKSVKKSLSSRSRDQDASKR